jgi:hypothetical protein
VDGPAAKESAMKTKFFCPHCRSVLNPGLRIILAVRLGEMRGLILLSPQPGNYHYVCDESFRSRMRIGDEVDFSCPICKSDLTSPVSEKLVEIVIKTPDQKTKIARFSRVCGEHATFVCNGQRVEDYGEHKSLFANLDFTDFDWKW